MGLELYERLLKTGVYKASPNIQVDTAAKRITLDQESSQLFFNGMAMSSYMLVFKQVLVSAPSLMFSWCLLVMCLEIE
jgi:hypothetical protein